MKYRIACFGSVILAVCVIILTGCAGSSKPSEFYLLRSLPASQNTVSTTQESGSPSVLIGPVTLPAYLDRSQIVTLARNHQLILDEFTRWAEPLQDNFYRVLVENLSLLLNTPKVYAFDRRGSMPTDFQIVIDVTRFDTTASENAYLTAFWTVVSKKNNNIHLMQRKSVFHAKVSSTSLKGAVDAQNRTLTEFSHEIATALQSLHQ
jgi:uncharacterized lipoprotein YmbA